MAQRRMFSMKIIDTDHFLDMPTSTQLLYFHLSMRADDDGFIASPKKIMKIAGCSDDDMKLLIAKGFVIPFESGVCVIKHWRIHNYIQTDRYNETMYKKEKAKLISDNGTYHLHVQPELIESVENTDDYNLDTKCIHDGYEMDTQVRLGKVRLELGKVRLDNNRSDSDESSANSDELTSIITAWNELGLQKLVSIKNNRATLLKARLKEYGQNSIYQCIEHIKESSFLRGQNNRSWIISFDWLIKPNNYIKVLERNYADKEVNGNGAPGTAEASERKLADWEIRQIESAKRIDIEEFEREMQDIDF